MQIQRGVRLWLTKSRGKNGGKKKVWKNTNQWFYCPSCMILFYFREFKCRFNFFAPIICPCGGLLSKAPLELCGEAKQIFPHFRSKRKTLGSANWYYGVYLKSNLWKNIRYRVLERDDHTCQRCKNAANIVHHKSYATDVIQGNNDAMLVSLCFDCHQFIEFDNDRKVTLAEANSRL